jgi:phospholipid/cholesterol/gamma-HCH transport system substrate-binding protein
MANEKKGRTETMVGIFLFTGLAIIGVLVVTFGRLGTALKAPYEITVLFTNVGGLASGADVMLSGAKVGFIAAAPQLVGDSYRVAVRLKVQQDIKIPRKSRFMVGSANLLGDKYIEIVPNSDMDPTDLLYPGEIIEGSRSGGFDELAARGGEVLDQLSESLKGFQTLTATINKKLLNDENLKNLSETFGNLRESSENFKKTSLTLDSVVSKTGSAAESVQKLTKSANEGKGALGLLLNDRETGDNLRSFIYNLRHSGVLFYKDRPLPEPENKRR